MPQEFITKKGLEKLKAELDELVNVKRPEIAGRIKDAVALGDLSENAEYSEAKDAQAFIEGRVSDIEEILRSTRLVSGRATDRSFVQVGCAVKLVSGENKHQFKLVGSGEGNPANGELSTDSPIGKAILGKVPGDEIEISTPTGKKRYKIIQIA